MTKAESKYFNTAKIMDDALITLLEKKDIRYISVKEICEKAGVNRSTFYLHYESIQDLIDEAIEYIQEDFNNSFNVKAEDFINKINEVPLQDLVLVNQTFLVPYLTYIKEHKHIYRASFSNSGTLRSKARMESLYRAVLKPIFCRFGIPENDQKYWLVYHVEGISAIIKEWLKCDCSETIEELSRIIEECVRADFGAMGKKYGES